MKDDLSRPLVGIEKQADRTNRALRRMGLQDGAKRSDIMSAATGRLVRQVRGLDGYLKGVSNTLQRKVATGLRMTAWGVGTLTAAIGGFGIKAASEFEQVRIALDGMLGSAERGAAMFEAMKQLNLRTPFELSDITAGGRQLLGFQIEEPNVLPLLKSVTDVAAGLGAGNEGLNRILLNIGQVQSQGVVTGRELRDFATIGFPGYALVANILGKTREEIRAMGDDAQVSSEDFIAAVMRMQGPLRMFSGMAEKQMNSLQGLWSNVKDAFSVRLADEASPLVVSLKEGMRSLTPLLGGMLDKVAPPVMDLLGQVMDVAADALPVITPLLTAIIAGVGELLTAAGPGLRGLDGVVLELARATGELVRELLPHMPTLAETFVALVGVLPEFVRLLGNVVPLVMPLANLATNLLEMDGAAAVLLATLLGYSALSGVAHAVMGLARAYIVMADARIALSAAEGVGAGTGLLRTVGMGVGRLGLGGAAIGGGVVAAQGFREDDALKSIGGATVAGAGTGALLGSVIPVVGTGVGALVGGGIGAAVGTVGHFRGRPQTGVPLAAAVPSGSGTFHNDIAIQVYQANSEIDIARAVEMGIDEAEQKRERRE